MTKQRPSIGRIAHWVDWDRQHLAAVVVFVAADAVVNLQAFTNSPEKPTQFVYSSLLDESGQIPGSWHFCEFVAPIELK